MMFINKKLHKKGFTIIELIVVMAVLAVLVSLGVPRFLNYVQDAQVTAMKADANILESAALQSYIDGEIDGTSQGDWPADGEPFTINDPDYEITIEKIDAAEVDKYVRSLSNDVGDFGIITEVDSEVEGVQDGEIVLVDHDLNEVQYLEDSNEDKFSGLFEEGDLTQ